MRGGRDFKFQGHTVPGDGAGIDIALSERTGVVVKNCRVKGFGADINLIASFGNTLTRNTAGRAGFHGFVIGASSDTALMKNAAHGNHTVGFFLISSRGNTLIKNTASANTRGLELEESSGNTLVKNVANDNVDAGLRLTASLIHIKVSVCQ